MDSNPIKTATQSQRTTLIMDKNPNSRHQSQSQTRTKIPDNNWGCCPKFRGIPVGNHTVKRFQHKLNQKRNKSNRQLWRTDQVILSGFCKESFPMRPWWRYDSVWTITCWVLLATKSLKLNIFFFWPQVEVPPSTLRFLEHYTIILQRIRIIAVDAGFEPGTSVPEVWRATNEPPHLNEN